MPLAFTNQIKSAVGFALFRASDVRRLHIVGCSRSGTTMLHVAMLTFKNTLIAGNETGIGYPHLGDRLALMPALLRLGRPRNFVTKRNYGWFLPERIAALVREARRESIGLIHLVRDPVDVLASRHHGEARVRQDQIGYVSAQHWSKSVAAWDRIRDGLPQGHAVLELRYEDVVEQPADVETKLCSAFGLTSSPGSAGINRIRSNLDLLGVELSAELVGAVGTIRDIDGGSIGKGRRLGLPLEQLVAEPEIRRQVGEFCAVYGYAPVK